MANTFPNADDHTWYRERYKAQALLHYMASRPPVHGIAFWKEDWWETGSSMELPVADDPVPKEYQQHATRLQQQRSQQPQGSKRKR